MDLGSLPHDWVAGRLNEEVDGTATAPLLAFHVGSSQTTFLNLDWWTSYKLGHAMGGGDGWRGPGKRASMGHWPEKP